MRASRTKTHSMSLRCFVDRGFSRRKSERDWEKKFYGTMSEETFARRAAYLANKAKQRANTLNEKG